jgi:hypothetical protein
MAPPNRDFAKEAGCDGDFVSRDFAPNISPMRRSTSAFFVRINGLRPAAEVREQVSSTLIAAVDHARASAPAVADVATLLNRYF